ncbi:MAG: hypothetical protein QOJ48_901 [Frankiales bacterium]|nr:hypothetical protein [Frankiales bacterium]
MEQLVAFSRYVGLVVAVFSALLVAPRATAAGWAFARRGFRRAETEEFTPVQVREGVRTAGHRHLRHFHGADPTEEVEVLDADGPRRRADRRRSDLAPLLELVDSRAVLVLLTGLLLVFAGDLVRLLPDGAVLSGDLVLVAVTFLVMRHVIYTYVPVERFEVAARLDRAHAPFDQLMRLVLLSAAVALLVTWPSQVGWQLASHSLGGRLHDQRVLVAWACELPWLLGLAWVVVRQRLAASAASRSS